MAKETFNNVGEAIEKMTDTTKQVVYVHSSTAGKTTITLGNTKFPSAPSKNTNGRRVPTPEQN